MFCFQIPGSAGSNLKFCHCARPSGRVLNFLTFHFYIVHGLDTTFHDNSIPSHMSVVLPEISMLNATWSDDKPADCCASSAAHARFWKRLPTGYDDECVLLHATRD